ncbi:MAG: PA14 domain-containing protein [Planctomycetota bacterium]|nr:PA14 domain-containing protein [Planctomycetota bacterium]
MLPRRADLFRAISVAVLIASVLDLPHASAQSIDHPIVPGYERFHSTIDSDLAGGLLLLGELNCTACHQAQAESILSALLLTKEAPILNEVGARVRPEFLRAFLADPQKTKPGTTMPNLFAKTSPTERDQQVEALVHFLASTGQLLEAGPIAPAVNRGEALFHDVGCVACHDARRENSPRLPTSVPLPVEMEAKYSIPGLIAFLKNPLHVRPSGRMPQLNLNDDESRDIASYLLKNLEAEGVIEFVYYEGSWQELPDFSTLTPVASGKTASFDVNIGRPDNFAVVFQAKFQIARDGKYRFHLGSDDGSRLKIAGNPIVDVNGIHPFSFQSGDIELKAGVHEVEVEYFEQGGEQELRVEFEGAGIKRQALEYALALPEKKPGDKPPFVVDAELAARGRQLFSSLGCASCHQLQVDGKRLAPERSAKPFASLNPANGCLSANPAGAPQYSLTDRQRASLKAAVELPAVLANVDLAIEPENTITAALEAFNCYACHQRGDRGGVEEIRNAMFKSDQPEMGDEGRIPPHLTGVGAKLQPDWIKQVFDNGAKDRPYMFTRMPRFGSQNIGHLVAAFGQADPDVADHDIAIDFDERHIKAAGRKLTGSEGFSCIKCHTWGNVKATGIQSINMVTMTRRLKENWFYQYLLNPQQYRPGTRMPAAWPQGQVLLPAVLDGKALTQIHSVWEYLSDGDQAAMPVGLGSDPIILTAYDEAIIYRNFIEGAGPRAIAVGYPEKLNQAFDANNLRIALLWHGAFMDASKHWLGRGPGFQAPLGDNVLKLPEGVSFANLDSPDASWPTQTAKELGYEFGGYRLGEAQRPTFLYSVGNTSIQDTLVATSSAQFTPAQRTITIAAESPVRNLWYRAASGNKIVPQDDGWYAVDGRWKTRVAGGLLREVGGEAELLVPVELENGKASIVQDYAW